MMYVKDLQEAFDGDLIVTKVNGIPVELERFKGEGAGIYKVSSFKAGFDELRIEIVGGTGEQTQGYTRFGGKPVSKMNANELRAYAVALGEDRNRLYGTSNDALRMIIRKLERENDGRC